MHMGSVQTLLAIAAVFVQVSIWLVILWGVTMEAGMATAAKCWRCGCCPLAYVRVMAAVGDLMKVSGPWGRRP